MIVRDAVKPRSSIDLKKSTGKLSGPDAFRRFNRATAALNSSRVNSASEIKRGDRIQGRAGPDG
eukprot:5228011-Prorocentrum_lima.AAC.1